MNFVMEKDHGEIESPDCHAGSTTSATLNYSCSIPLPSTHISRTESEAQLAVDIAAAEERDERMFHRLINGIHTRHQKQVTNKAGFRTSRIAPACLESTDKAASKIVALEKTPTNNGYCPVTAIAKIVGTHHAQLNDSQDRILNCGLQSSDEEDDKDGSTLPLSEMQRQFQFSRVARTSESTLSDNDWSISGFSGSQDPNHEYFVDNRSIIETEAPSGEGEDDDDEEIFILDL